jgi:subtilisin family serine protease
VRYAWEQGVVVVAAAGNNGSPVSDYPEDSPVLLVGATDEDDRPAAFSDRGRADSVLAPGVGIISTWCRAPGEDGCSGRTHSYGVAEGTSFAAPHVAGVAALLAADGLSARQIVRRIRATAVDIGDRAHGHGRVDAAAALHTSGEVEPPRATREGDGGLVAASDEARDRATPRPSEPRPAPEPEAAPPPPDPEPAPEPTTDPQPDPAPQGDEELAEPPQPEPAPETEPAPVDPESGEPADDLDGQAVGVPHDGPGPVGEVALQLVAAGLVGTALATWSAVARREL